MIEMKEKTGYESELNDWVGKEKAAVSLISSLGKLMYNKGTELVLFRNHLVDTSVSEVLKLHDYADKIVNRPIDVRTSAKLADILCSLNLKPSKIDIGKLSHEWHSEGKNYDSEEAFLNDKLSAFIGDDLPSFEPQDVVLFGFGRIGRLAARELIKQAGKGQQLRLRAIVVRRLDDAEIIKRAALLRNDSVHGKFAGTIVEDLERKALIINGQLVKLIQSNTPEEANYEAHGIKDALIIDNTGVYKDREDLSRHLKAKGAKKVLLTAPGSGIPNVVYGINSKDLDIENENIYSAASCTTNAISPVLKVVEDNFGIEKGHIETVHAYTNDQNLLDNMHKKPRRGRSAAINMVITSTGAGKAVTKVIPSLDGKLTANAVRVPTPNGSLAIMSLNLKKETNLEELNNTIRVAALKGDLINQINYNIDPELVSNDIIGNTCCSVYDSNATIVSNDGKNAVLYTWYDNEFGYTKQVIRLAKYIAKVRRLIYY
jgi:glyceraldehyde 3-phosphate dehydrogenase